MGRSGLSDGFSSSSLLSSKYYRTRQAGHHVESLLQARSAQHQLQKRLKQMSKAAEKTSKMLKQMHVTVTAVVPNGVLQNGRGMALMSHHTSLSSHSPYCFLSKNIYSPLSSSVLCLLVHYHMKLSPKLKHILPLTPIE